MSVGLVGSLIKLFAECSANSLKRTFNDNSCWKRYLDHVLELIYLLPGIDVPDVDEN